ncbi:hypothetical protein KBD08_04120 [Candidatus Babeliales bacterium]|nr:hypothetical protein [Candidatus Babeliales bacterium]
MKTQSKALMILALGLGVYVSSVHADNLAQNAIDEIHTKFETTLNMPVKNSQELTHFLTQVQKELTIILNKSHGHADLKKAVASLKPAQVLSMIPVLKEILKHLHPKTKSMILERVPLQFRPLLS